MIKTSTEKLQKKINRPYAWIREGLIWGVWMFLVVGVLLPWAFDKELNQNNVLSNAAIWLVAGLIYGFITVKFFWPFLIKKLDKKGDK